MRYFESSQLSDPMSVFIESSKIADYKPLIKRGTSSRFVFSPITMLVTNMNEQDGIYMILMISMISMISEVV